MANRFWVGGSGTWDGVTTTNWSASSGGAGGASAPTTSDAVIFDTNSGTGVVSCPSGSPVCASFDASASSVLTLGVNAPITCAGSFVGGANMTISGNSNFQITPSSAATFKLNGSNVSGLLGFLFAAAPNSTTIDFLDDFLGGTTITLEIDAGTINTNNHTINCGILSYGNTGTKVANLGSSTITASNEYIYIGSALTHNPGTSTVITPSYSNTLNFYNLTYQANASGSVAIATVSNNFTIQGGAATNIALTLAGNLSVGAALNLTGNSPVNRFSLFSSAAGTARTLTCVGANFSNVDLQDMTLSNSGSFTGTSLGNCGRNTGISFPAPTTYYWIDPGTSPNFQSANWATSSGGIPGTGFPCPGVDTALFDANSFPSGSRSLNIAGFSGARLPSMDFTGVTNNPTLSLNTGNQLYGSTYKFNSGMTISGTGATSIPGGGTVAMETGGATWTSTLTMNGINGTLGFSGNFVSSSSFTHNNGTLNRGSNNLQFSSFISSSGSTRIHNGGSGILTLTGTGTAFNIGNATGLTYNKGTGIIKFTNAATSNKTFAGAGLSYETIYVNTTNTGTFNVTGSNTFNNILADPGRTIKFTAATTTTVGGLPSGNSGSHVTITSITAAAHTLTSSGGIIGCDYLTLSQSTASQINTFYAGANSTNSGSNTNWLFQAAPLPTSVGTINGTLVSKIATYNGVALSSISKINNIS